MLGTSRFPADPVTNSRVVLFDSKSRQTLNIYWVCVTWLQTSDINPSPMRHALNATIVPMIDIPYFDFFEPRFAEAREKIQPQFCLSCHLEHSGKRVTTF